MIIRGTPSCCAEVSRKDQARNYDEPTVNWLMSHSPECGHRFHFEHFSLSRGMTEVLLSGMNGSSLVV